MLSSLSRFSPRRPTSRRRPQVVTPRLAKPTIVLVHGAWADASGWYDVTRALQARGYKVVAVQNSLFSYAKDIETTKRVIDAQQGPLSSSDTLTVARRSRRSGSHPNVFRIRKERVLHRDDLVAAGLQRTRHVVPATGIRPCAVPYEDDRRFGSRGVTTCGLRRDVGRRGENRESDESIPAS